MDVRGNPQVTHPNPDASPSPSPTPTPSPNPNLNPSPNPNPNPQFGDALAALLADAAAEAVAARP